MKEKLVMQKVHILKERKTAVHFWILTEREETQISILQILESLYKFMT